MAEDYCLLPFDPGDLLDRLDEAIADGDKDSIMDAIEDLSFGDAIIPPYILAEAMQVLRRKSGKPQDMSYETISKNSELAKMLGVARGFHLARAAFKNMEEAAAFARGDEEICSHNLQRGCKAIRNMDRGTSQSTQKRVAGKSWRVVRWAEFNTMLALAELGKIQADGPEIKKWLEALPPGFYSPVRQKTPHGHYRPLVHKFIELLNLE